jgi:outer membrane protein
MKRYLALGCFGVGLLVSPLLAGVGHATVPSNPKVGVIDFHLVFETSPAGKRANEPVLAAYKAKQAILDKQLEDLRKANANLDVQKPTMKPQDFDVKKQELDTKALQLMYTGGKIDRELTEAKARLAQDLLGKAQPRINQIAKAEGVTVVLDKPSTLWSDPAMDLTAKLVAELQ